MLTLKESDPKVSGFEMLGDSNTVLSSICQLGPTSVNSSLSQVKRYLKCQDIVSPMTEDGSQQETEAHGIEDYYKRASSAQMEVVLAPSE